MMTLIFQRRATLVAGCSLRSATHAPCVTPRLPAAHTSQSAPRSPKNTCTTAAIGAVTTASRVARQSNPRAHCHPAVRITLFQERTNPQSDRSTH